MTAYNGNPVPPEGQAITYVDGGFVIPDTTGHSLHRGRRNRARHLESLATGI